MFLRSSLYSPTYLCFLSVCLVLRCHTDISQERHIVLCMDASEPHGSCLCRYTPETPHKQVRAKCESDVILMGCVCIYVCVCVCVCVCFTWAIWTQEAGEVSWYGDVKTEPDFVSHKQRGFQMSFKGRANTDVFQTFSKVTLGRRICALSCLSCTLWGFLQSKW